MPIVQYSGEPTGQPAGYSCMDCQHVLRNGLPLHKCLLDARRWYMLGGGKRETENRADGWFADGWKCVCRIRGQSAYRPASRVAFAVESD